MSLNCNELNLILSELNLEGSFIQEIIQPGFDTLSFRIIRGGDLNTLLFCLSAGACRICYTQGKIPKNKKPLRFNEFLKSRVQGMRINSAKQIGLDRIVKFDISTWKERLFMYVRLWSGAANIIVTDEEGNILDCMYRRPAKGEVSGGKFSAEEKEVSQEEKENSLKRFPIRDFSELKKYYQEKFNSEKKDKRPFEELSFNEKINLFYSEHAASLSRESLLAQAEKWYNVRHSKMQGAIERLEAKQKDFSSADKLKHTGDLILTYAAQAKGSILDCIDYESGQEVHIRLDPKLSPHENAEKYYTQYKKELSGREALARDILSAKKELALLEKEYQSMLNEKNVLKIEQMLRKDTSPKQKEEKAHPGLHYEIDGWTIIVGRTATENDDLLRHYVKGADMWLHTRDYAGGYVFIKAQKNKSVPLEILLYAGNLAVYHSKARNNAQADLYYTQVKFLRRAKGGPKGLVLPTQEKNIFIKLDKERLSKLDG